MLTFNTMQPPAYDQAKNDPFLKFPIFLEKTPPFNDFTDMQSWAKGPLSLGNLPPKWINLDRSELSIL